MTAPNADDGDLTDDELAAMVAAALLAVKKQRDRTHDEAAAALLAVLAVLASGYDPTVLRSLDPEDPRALRRALAAADLTRQAQALGVDPDWEQAVRDAHTAAVLAGTAAAAHVLTAGAVPVEPVPSPFPNPFNPRGWMGDQTHGLAGDLVDALDAALTAGDELTDAAAAEILADGAGALYYLDAALSQAYLDASTALYVSVGVVDLIWHSMGDSRVCGACSSNEAGSPYSPQNVPGVPHGLCRCWITPG